MVATAPSTDLLLYRLDQLILKVSNGESRTNNGLELIQLAEIVKELVKRS